MVLPQDRLTTKLSHIGMINGKKIIKVETFNQNGSKVCFIVYFSASQLKGIYFGLFDTAF